MSTNMVDSMLDSLGDGPLYGVGVIHRHHTASDLEAINRMLHVGIKYIDKLIGRHSISVQLSSHGNYIVVYVFSSGMLPASLFMRMFDIPLLIRKDGDWLVIDRRKADDVIAKARIFNLPVIRRAPSGGAVVWLLRYKGGQFMPVRAFASGMAKDRRGQR